MILEIRNPFKKNVNRKSNGIKNLLGDLLGRLSGITLQATSELAEKKGQITRLQYEASGLEAILEQNQDTINVISHLLGDRNTQPSPIPPDEKKSNLRVAMSGS